MQAAKVSSTFLSLPRTVPHPLTQPYQALYQRSVDVKKTASSLFNLGVTHYHLSTRLLSISLLRHVKIISYHFLIFLEEFDQAINAWKESIALQPSSPDAHTSPYQLFPPRSSPTF